MMIWKTLRERGLLGINQRNIVFTQGENPRKLYPLVDDKLKTKALCDRAGIPTAAVLALAESHGAVSGLIESLHGQSDFVIKPAKGAMGNGILVVGEAQKDGWLDSRGERITESGLAYHAESIISGLYALSGQMDVVFAEERIRVAKAFEKIAYRGVPDIRVIIFRGVPVMAMTRLPTQRSAGKANLHQGAVGAGIDLGSGRTNFAVIGNKAVEKHPDTGEDVVGFSIPRFGEALRVALFATDQTGLGYVGADVVIDDTLGPMILELNARPGLAIQLANRAGLVPRLDAIRERLSQGMPIEHREALGQEIASELCN